jgi:short-chain fatty acids transporter
VQPLPAGQVPQRHAQFLMGVYIVVSHLWNKGFDLNLDIMNFLFIILGMMAHKTPIR